MEQLGISSVLKSSFNRIHATRKFWVWEFQRYVRLFSRALGIWGWSFFCIFIMGVIVFFSTQILKQQMQNWQTHHAQAVTVIEPPGKPQGSTSAIDSQNDFLYFEQLLVPHGDIPQVVGDLLHLAEEKGVSIRDANYQVSQDAQGQFMRYRMIMPIEGDADIIDEYVQTALQLQPSLALEKVQFKRQDAGSTYLEARIHWVLFTQLPEPNMTHRDQSL